MQIKRYSDGSMKLHFFDDDEYGVIKGNGLDVWLSKKDVDRIKKVPA